MRLSFLLASAFTFGLTTASIAPRAPAPAPSASGISQQCESTCNSLNEQGLGLFGGGASTSEAAATAAACQDANFQKIKVCYDCNYNLSPSSFTPQLVQTLQSAVDAAAAECTKRGFPVRSVSLTGKSGAALSRFEGSAKVVGAVGVAAVAGFFAL